MFGKRSRPNNAPRCSFCNKGEDAAGTLISSPRNDDPRNAQPSYICEECVAVCNSILEDRRQTPEDQAGEAADGRSARPQ